MHFWNTICPPNSREITQSWSTSQSAWAKSTLASFPLNLQVYARSFASYVSRLRLSLLDNFLNVFTVSDRFSLQPAPFLATGPIFWNSHHFFATRPIFLNPPHFVQHSAFPILVPTCPPNLFAACILNWSDILPSWDSSLKFLRQFFKKSWGIGIFSAGRLSRCHSRYNRLYRRFQGLFGLVLWLTCFEKSNWVGGFPPPPSSTSVDILLILVIKVLTSSEESDKYEQAHRFLQLLEFWRMRTLCRFIALGFFALLVPKIFHYLKSYPLRWY